jgi:hypothetical protein
VDNLNPGYVDEMQRGLTVVALYLFLMQPVFSMPYASVTGLFRRPFSMPTLQGVFRGLPFQRCRFIPDTSLQIRKGLNETECGRNRKK